MTSIFGAVCGCSGFLSATTSGIGGGASVTGLDSSFSYDAPPKVVQPQLPAKCERRQLFIVNPLTKEAVNLPAANTNVTTTITTTTTPVVSLDVQKTAPPAQVDIRIRNSIF